MTGESARSVQGLPEQRALRYIDLSRTTFATDAASLLPEETARRYRAVPVERRGDVTLVAVANPANPLTLEALREGAGCDVTTVVASPDQVTTAIAALYGGPTRNSRRRGQHVAADGPEGADGPIFETLRFASSEALAADNGLAAYGAREEMVNGSSSLEESLRSVLVPPEADRNLPVLDPSAGGDDEAQGGEPPAGPIGASVVNGARSGGTPTPHNGAPPAAGATANGAAPNGAAANGAISNGAAANGAAGGGAAGGGPAKAGPGAPPEEAPPGDNWPSGSVAGVSVADTPGSGLGSMKDHPHTPASGLSSGREITVTSSPGHPGLDKEPAGAHPTHTSATEPPDGDARPQEDPAARPGGPATPPPPPPGFGSVEGDSAMEEASVHWPPLARVLVRAGTVSFDQMVHALRAHRESGEPLARYLFSQKLATEDDLVQAMAEEVGLAYVDLTAYPVDPNVAALVPEAVARRHMVLPIRLEEGVPVVAMANPTDVFAMDDLRSIMGRNFTPVVATRSQIELHLRQLQESSGGDVQEAAQSAAGAAGAAGGGFELESLQSVVEDAPIVRYVNLLILQALNERASDIHIEPTPKRLRIRFRIDGVMHDASSASPAIHNAVISRLKVLGEMDITEHRVPQEGRVSVSVGERQIDLRLAILPSQFGETCVMRLLDKSASIRRLSELGFFPDTLERYAQAYNHPYGVILVTGPTGAGKTTTLYATLQEVMSSEKSVVTVEDPVEYQIDGITQVQINAKVGLHFSTALRSILRADPDIILVGEIRDIETASIAMEAALSGHLVLSTLHTNTAAGTPLRLTEMGIEPFLVTSAVGGVLTQRLARVLCERCKTPYSASLTDFYAAGYREVDLEELDVSTLYRAAGCRTCSHTGYHGRMLLAEVMPITEEIERMIIEQQSIVAIERQAVEQGMRTLRQDGLRKALAGFTTLEEVLRVVV